MHYDNFAVRDITYSHYISVWCGPKWKQDKKNSEDENSVGFHNPQQVYSWEAEIQMTWTNLHKVF